MDRNCRRKTGRGFTSFDIVRANTFDPESRTNNNEHNLVTFPPHLRSGHGRPGVGQVTPGFLLNTKQLQQASHSQMNPSIQTQTLFRYVPIHVRHTKFGAQKQAQTSQKARAHFPVRSVCFLFRLCVQKPSACQGKILLKRALKATWTKSSFRAPVWAPKKGEKSPTTSKYLQCMPLYMRHKSRILDKGTGSFTSVMQPQCRGGTVERTAALSNL